MKKLILAVVLAAAIYGLWSWNSGAESRAANSAEPVATAERRNIESTLLLTGEVTPAFQIDVKPEVGGKIKELSIEVGQTVKKGDLLAIIDDTDLLTEKQSAQTEVDGAVLAVEKTKGNYERAKALYQQKLISKEVFANLESDYEIAKNTVEKADRRLQVVEDRLRKTRILAPVDGTVLSVPVTIKEGAVVTAAASVNSGTLLMTFANLSKLYIYSHVNQVDAPRLTTGQKVEINVADQEPIKAHIEFIAPLATVKNNVKGFEVHAAIDDETNLMKPGMSVSMTVPVGRAENAVSVPVTAVFSNRRENVVYVRNGGATERRKVDVGIMDLSHAEIKKGVKEGETILLIEPSGSPKKS